MSVPAYPDDFRPPDAVADTLDCDVLVVGGGINGAGIARDLAGRGWKVVLCEQDDLAAHTSSASTKLIHGGLRYLERGDFMLVRKALAEREVLMRSAPHIMHPLRFVLPHDASRHMRPGWMLRLGLFLYDHLARRDLLPGSAAVDLRSHAAGAALRPDLHAGFVYSDGWVDDARLVILAAIDARERGATILTRTRCTHASATGGRWHATLQDRRGLHRRVRARALVNATGPWAASFLRERVLSAGSPTTPRNRLRLVRGSHIVVRRGLSEAHPQDHAFIFQNPDGRIVFAIPYEGEHVLIGTTDVELPSAAGVPRDAEHCSDAEVAYLCEQANRWLREPVAPADVVWRFAGVRPLLDDAAGNPAAVTRDYQLELDASAAPLLNVWGGKITTFRRLAEEAGDRVGRMLGEARAPWTREAVLPGGDLTSWIGAPRHPQEDFGRFVQALRQRHPWLPDALAQRWARTYGSRIDRVIGSASSLADLGCEVAPGLFEAELLHAIADEWAVEADDVLWRRTKLGLHLDNVQRLKVTQWLNDHEPAPPSRPWARSNFATDDFWSGEQFMPPDMVAV